MSKRRSLLGIVALLGFITLFVLTYGYTRTKAEEVVCRSVSVRVMDSGELNFVTPRRVQEYLRVTMGDLRGRPAHEVNTHAVEQHLMKLPAVRTCQVYTDALGMLSIDLWQRRPKVRIMSRDGRSCYIDGEGMRFNLDSLYAAHTLVVSGNISYPPAQVGQGVDSLFWSTLFEFVSYVDDHPLWHSLIGQVYVANAKRIELIPRVGGFIVVLGPCQDYRYKLRKLRSLYQASLPAPGLDAYREINLAFTNQVICTKWE